MMEWAPRRRLTHRRRADHTLASTSDLQNSHRNGGTGPWGGCPRLTCSFGDILCHNGISVIVATRTATRWLRTSPPHPHGCGDGLWRFGRRVVAHTSKLSHRSVRQDVDGLFKDVAARYRVLQAPHEMQWAIPTG
jgi:hypothetical protein